MPLTITNTFLVNLQSSVEAWLNTNIVTPYNTAVTGTTYSKPLRIMLRPEDGGMIASVPAIILPDMPDDASNAASTGIGDNMVWKHTAFDMEVYPALAVDTNGTQKPSINSAQLLQSLFTKLSTALTVPIYDYSVPATPVLLGGSYVTECRIVPVHGSIKSLALHRNRFDVILVIRYEVLALS